MNWFRSGRAVACENFKLDADKSVGQAGDVDTASVLVSSASGQQVQIINSRRAAYGYDQIIQAFGSLGLIQVPNQRKTLLIHSDEQGARLSPYEYFFTLRYERSFENEMLAFVEAIRSKQGMSVTGFEGSAALLLAEKAFEALSEQKTVFFDLTSEIKALVKSR